MTKKTDFWSMQNLNEMAPRDVFGKVLVEMGTENERIVGVCPDVMVSTRFNEFAKKFPERFWNTGVAEQCSFGIAAGLATFGLIPFVSTWAAFVSMRACEQIRTDIAYPRLNVKIVGSHCGLSGGKNGTTHHSTEDIAILRSMANMVVVVPCDPFQVVKTFRWAVEYEGPCYIRLVRGVESPVKLYEREEDCPPFKLGKANLIKDGNDITVIATGSPPVQNALTAAEELEKEGVHVRLIEMPSVKPIDKDAIVKAAEETKAIITVEDHSIVGGLGGAVAEVLCETRPTYLKRVGVPDIFATVGTEQPLWKKYGLDADGIKKTAREVLTKVG
jgi:transketolase